MSVRIPTGWRYWCNGGESEEAAWFHARFLKEEREGMRPDLFVRVKVVRGPVGGGWWILRREEERQETGT